MEFAIRQNLIVNRSLRAIFESFRQIIFTKVNHFFWAISYSFTDSWVSWIPISPRCIHKNSHINIIYE